MRSVRLALFTLLLVGYSVSAQELLPPDRPVEAVIDHYIQAKLDKNKVVPASQIDDFNLIRRLTLDLNGRIPTSAETKAFVESTNPQKRAELVDRLMASAAFIRHQGNQFDAMMAGPNSRGGSGLREYLTKSLGDGKPWDKIFRELMTPDDSDPKQKGASEFLKGRVTDLDRLTNDVSVVFFGVNVSCAQCHDHPLVNDWKQDHFYGMKSFFVRTFDNGGFLAEREFGAVKFKPTKGPERQAKMMFLSGAAIDAPGQREASKDEEKKEREKLEQFKKDKKAPPAPSFSARAKLVDVALQPSEGQFFARSLANRLWHRFMGYGLVNPLDQMHSENPPSHPELLAWLARDAASDQYRMRKLIRGIVMSQAYSRSTRWTGDSLPSPTMYAVGRMKPLTPLQLATSLKIATADPVSFDNLKPEEFEKRIEAIEASARGFASLIAQPTDDFLIGVNEALLFSNNNRVVSEYLAEGGDKLLTKLKNTNDPAKAIDLVVRTVLSRPATPEEVKLLSEYLSRRSDRLAEAYKQVVWALVCGSEFRFNY